MLFRSSARGALEQLHIQGSFELFDATAEGRLRDPDGIGGSAKTTLVYYGAEGLEVVEVEVDDHGGRPMGIGMGGLSYGR